MDQIFIVKLEQEANGRRYSFHIPVGAPFVEVKEIIKAFGEAVDLMEKESIERAEKAKAEAEQTEQPAAEPSEG